MRQIIIDAINKNLRIKLNYHNYFRIVEPHTFGRNKAGNDMFCAWQVSGGSASNEPIGWKNFLILSDINGVELLNEAALTPRKGYKRGDSRMSVIYCQV